MELEALLSPAEYLFRDPVFMGLVVAMILGAVVWNLFHRHLQPSIRNTPPPMLLTVGPSGRKMPIQTVRPEALRLPGYQPSIEPRLEKVTFDPDHDAYAGRFNIPLQLRTGRW